MGKRGPKPTPNSIRKKTGNPGKRQTKKPAIEPPGIAIKPDWLDGIASKSWERLAPQLSKLGLLTKIDGDAFARYCHLAGIYELARKDVDEYGLVLYTSNGNAIQNPSVGVMNQADKQLSRYEQSFGMTPAARVGLNVEPPESDGLADYLL